MTAVSKNYKNNVSGGDLYWPANISEKFDYLEMEMLQFEERSIRKLRPSKQVQDNVAPQETSSGESSTAGTPSKEYFNSKTTTTSSLGKILLPIPDNISYTDGPQWSDQSVGAIGRFGAEAINNAIGGDSDNATEAIQLAASAIKAGVIKNMLNKIGVDPNALAQNVAGKIANPYMQQVFQGVGLRQFDFNWKLVPRNEREQRSIKRIIKVLRSNVMPGFSNSFLRDQQLGPGLADILSPDLQTKDGVSLGAEGDQDTERWLTVPNIFNLKWKYMGNDIESLPKLKQCVCKNISVQYTPDGVWATRMMDGKPQPIAYNLTMSFGEMSIITNEDVFNRGF
jgi:hypothetical protein